MIARSSSSQGARSASSSGSPRAIFAIAAGVWWSSASTKRQPSATASAVPTVVLPLPATPMTTMTALAVALSASEGGGGRGGIDGGPLRPLPAFPFRRRKVLPYFRYRRRTSAGRGGRAVRRSALARDLNRTGPRTAWGGGGC